MQKEKEKNAQEIKIALNEKDKEVAEIVKERDSLRNEVESLKNDHKEKIA